MCEQNQVTGSLTKRHSCYTTLTYSCSAKSSYQGGSKSDDHIYYSNTSTTSTRSKDTPVSREYYKKYEHDEVPVKDDSSYNDHSFSEDNEIISGDKKDSITNSDLDKLEMKILSKISQELQTDDDDVNSLESNIKLFRTTVQQIFDNFYSNMQDFELYKKRFNEILEKNKEDSFPEMEEFIRDMIQNIGSSKSSINKQFKALSKGDMEKGDCKINVADAKHLNAKNNLNSTVDTFVNDNYLTDSTFNEGSSKFNSDAKTEETFNIYLLGTPCLEIKMTNRDMRSEIKIRDKHSGAIQDQLASAENIKKLAAKKLQIENYARLRHEPMSKDKDNIPVKNTTAKKNIHLNEDFTCEDKEENKFFIFKICNYICRKFRKNI